MPNDINSNKIIRNYLKKGGNDIYCDLIIPKKIQMDIAYENDFIIIVKHSSPLADYHFVIASKKHILDINEPDFKDIYSEVLNGISKALSFIPYHEVGAKVETNLGKYQNSKHLHIHVIGGKQRIQ